MSPSAMPPGLLAWKSSGFLQQVPPDVRLLTKLWTSYLLKPSASDFTCYTSFDYVQNSRTVKLVTQPKKGRGWIVDCEPEPTATFWLKGFNLLRKTKSPFLCCHGNSSTMLGLLSGRLPWSRAGERGFLANEAGKPFGRKQSCQRS